MSRTLALPAVCLIMVWASGCAAVATEVTLAPETSTPRFETARTATIPSPAITTVAVGLSDVADPLWACEPSLHTGKIVVTQTPFSSALSALADPNARYYMPSMSQDGTNLAFVAVASWPGQETIYTDFRLMEYPASDSVWVTTHDGHNLRQVSDHFARSEVYSPHVAGESCDLVSGIIALNGWSDDGTRLAFVYRPADGPNFTGPELYVIDVTSGQQTLLDKGILSWSPVWLTGSHQLAAISRDSGQVRIYDVDLNQSPLVLQPPVEMPTDHFVTGLVWNPFDRSLLILTKGVSDQDSPPQIWQVDLLSRQWQLLAGLLSAQQLSTSFVLLPGVICDFVRAFALDSQQKTITPLSMPFDVDCRNFRSHYSGPGQVEVIYTPLAGAGELWTGTLTDNQLIADKAFNIFELAQESSLQISYISSSD